MVPDRDQASDCVQEAFFSAYRNLKAFRGGSVKSWLNRIASTRRWTSSAPASAGPSSRTRSSRTRAGSRRPARRPIPAHDRAPDGASPGPQRRALPTITDDQRAAIVLFDVEGYDYAEIAT